MVTEAYPPKAEWVPTDMPDLTGQVVIVTGGNSGVGKEMVKALLARNARVYIACRSLKRATEAINELKEEIRKEALFLEMDLADLASIKKGVQSWLKKEQKLDVLFNNAGVMWCPVEHTTKEGYDMQWGTNVLGHHFLTSLLLPTLLATAKNSPTGTARVVNTASSGYMFGNVDWESLDRAAKGRKRCADVGTGDLYYNSKLGNVLLSTYLHNHYHDQGIIATSLNPGNLRSSLLRHIPQWQENLAMKIIHPVEMGAITGLYGGIGGDAKLVAGKHLIPWARIGTKTTLGADVKLADDVWGWCEAQEKACGVFY
ncbi:hypothetical protein CPB85DRAFT_1376265 [Mucidula mucida]|nr:hypothetical protein CPB85DRAFT_1376265 [Mucidula mucida]